MRKIPIAEGKVRVLRKVWKDGTSYGGFQHPTEIGGIVEAPDWNTEPKCGGGIHGLLEAQGEWGLLDGELWQVYEVDKHDIVEIGKNVYYPFALGKVKFRRGVLVYVGGKKGLLGYFDPDKFTSRVACQWGRIIGDCEIMRERVTESEWAYWWGKSLGDREIMRERITESEWAYWWSRNIGDREIMRERVTESQWAYWWAKNLGDREIMRERVTEPEWAYIWARNIGDREIMRERAKEKEWADTWKDWFLE